MDALRQIRKKKQELYDQIAMTERRYDTGLWGEGFQNRQLLQHLSVQIEPKPNDPVWYYLKHMIIFSFIFCNDFSFN
jgi:hypothetical protein